MTSQLISIIIMIISSIFAALGQLNMKMGSMKLKLSLNHTLKNYALLSGFFFYGMATITGIIALRGAELTIIYPLASLNYVWVSLLSMKFLKEKMNKYKWMGIISIIIGVSIIL